MRRGFRPRNCARKYGINDPTFYTWRKKYGGIEVKEARRLKAPEEENARFKEDSWRSQFSALTPMLERRFHNPNPLDKSQGVKK